MKCKNQKSQKTSLYLSTAVPIKVLIVIVAVLVLTSAVCVILYTNNYVKKVNEEVSNSYFDYADTFNSSVESKIKNYKMAMGIVGLNDSIRKGIFSVNTTRTDMIIEGQALSNLIQELTYFSWRAEDVYEHSLYTYLPSDGHYFKSISDAPSQPWYPNINNRDDRSYYYYSYSAMTRSNLITFVSAIDEFENTALNTESNENTPKRCFQVLTVNTCMLFKMAPNVVNNLNVEVYVFDNATKKIVLKSNGIYKNEAAQFYSQNDFTNDKKIRNFNKDKVAITRHLDGINASVLFLFDSSQLTQRGNSAEMSIVRIFVVVFLILLMVLTVFYSLFIKRMMVLNRKMDQFDENSENNSFVLSGNDEIARIDTHLTEMQARIKALIQESYATKLENINAQNEALLACINPHFLYNTLNTISSMSFIEGATDTGKMLDALSDMFRYSATVTEKFVTVEAELKNVTDYLYIQGIRYQNKFEYKVDIPPSLLTRLVPKLVLQPVVENSFKHGFIQKSGKKTLLLSAYEKDEDFYLEVYDDGTGITPDRLLQIKQYMTSPENSTDETGISIGLRNVHRRIQFAYGENYGIQINSKYDSFTSVVLKLGNKGEK